MAPLLQRYFARSQRSLLSSLFTATFLGALVVVAFPCPVRQDGHRPLAHLQDGAGAGEVERSTHGRGSGSGNGGDLVVVMNTRGRRRFMEES
jgi:hypothetical protein